MVPANPRSAPPLTEIHRLLREIGISWSRCSRSRRRAIRQLTMVLCRSTDASVVRNLRRLRVADDLVADDVPGPAVLGLEADAVVHGVVDAVAPDADVRQPVVGLDAVVGGVEDVVAEDVDVGPGYEMPSATLVMLLCATVWRRTGERRSARCLRRRSFPSARACRRRWCCRRCTSSCRPAADRWSSDC